MPLFSTDMQWFLKLSAKQSKVDIIVYIIYLFLQDSGGTPPNIYTITCVCGEYL